MARTGHFSKDELDEAQARYGLRFPRDLVELLRGDGIPDGYDWSGENPRIREMLAWPFEMLHFDVEQGFWWPKWGERPANAAERAEVIRAALKRAPRLIPLHAHRFLPDDPSEAGNPIFSMHGFDTVYYGADLRNYLAAELGHERIGEPKRRIAFWSDLTERFDDAYAYYEVATAELR